MEGARLITDPATTTIVRVATVAHLGAITSLETVIRPSDATLVRSILAMGNRRMLARIANLTNGFVSRVFNSKRGTSIVTFKRLADAAGVSLDDLYWYLYQRNAGRRLPIAHRTLKELILAEAKSRCRENTKTARFRAACAGIRRRSAKES